MNVEQMPATIGAAEYTERKIGAKFGSDALRDRIIRSLSRYADNRGIDIDTAAYRLISKGVM